MPVTSLLCYVLRFKCCGFPSYVSNQNISMAIDTFQLPECLHEYDTEIVTPYWIPLSSFIPAWWQMQEGVRDNMGKGRKEPATYRDYCIQLLYLMFPCSQKIPFKVHAEQFRVQTTVLHGYSELALFSSRSTDCMEHSSYSFFATPGQMHGNCTLCVVISCKLYVSLTDVLRRDFGFSIPLCRHTSKLLLKLC